MLSCLVAGIGDRNRATRFVVGGCAERERTNALMALGCYPRCVALILMHEHKFSGVDQCPKEILDILLAIGFLEMLGD